jgi:bla regulator protein BlaR1
MAISPTAMLAWIDAIGWTLLHFLWQGALLGLLYAVVRPLFPGVAARYRLGMGVLLAMLACPPVTLAYVWPGAVVPANGAALALPSVSIAAGAAAPGITSATLEAWLPWLVAVWFVGVSVIALRAFAHWRRLSWLLRNASIPLADCTEVLEKLCRRFGISRRIRLLGSMAIDTPMLIGWLRPVILLPLSMLSGFTPQQIELIIAHELGHVRRWDYLANLLQVVIETVLFYHPVVHWVSRDVRDARESCCEDLVLALADGSPVVYASALAELEQLRHDGALAAPALAATGGVLLERIRRIVGAQSVLYDPLPRSGGWPIVLLAAAGMLATLRLHAPPPTPEPGLLTLPGTGSHTAAIVASVGAQTRGRDTAPVAATARAVPVASAPDSTRIAATPDLPAEHQAAAAASEREVPITPVARPKITLAAIAPAAPRASDIRERIAFIPALAAPAAEVESAAAPRMPTALQRVQPDYPQREKIRGITGTVELQFSIDNDGNVRDVSVIGSTPDHVFDHVAIAALRQWRFGGPGNPAQRYTQTFAFELGTRAPTNEACHEVTGSHICRHVAAGEEPPQ